MKQQQQPAMGMPYVEPNVDQKQVVGVGEFSTGLCDCFSDVRLCCLTCWCPCITFGRIAEIVDKGSSSSGANRSLYSLIKVVAGCQWIYSFTYRSKLKAQYGMPENSYADCCTHFWCEKCALCQEYRELEHRGYNVALGWDGNMKQNQGIVAPPSTVDGMTR